MNIHVWTYKSLECDVSTKKILVQQSVDYSKTTFFNILCVREFFKLNGAGVQQDNSQQDKCSTILFVRW